MRDAPQKSAKPTFDKMDDNVTYMLATVAKQAENEMTTLLSGTNLNITAYRIIASLAEYDTVSISDLGRILRIDRAQVSRAAVVMEGQGYVAFADHPQNRRKKMVSLTEGGRTTLAEIAPRFAERRRRMEDALGPKRLADTLDALHILSADLPD